MPPQVARRNTLILSPERASQARVAPSGLGWAVFDDALPTWGGGRYATLPQAEGSDPFGVKSYIRKVLRLCRRRLNNWGEAPAEPGWTLATEYTSPGLQEWLAHP